MGLAATLKKCIMEVSPLTRTSITVPEIKILAIIFIMMTISAAVKSCTQM